jgi:DNA invertase Pin-like site-specific DNA recombinase
LASDTYGRVLGRKPKITDEKRIEIANAVSSGRTTPAEIARLLKIHGAAVSRIVSSARVGL